jgi:hypothetical protein
MSTTPTTTPTSAAKTAIQQSVQQSSSSLATQIPQQFATMTSVRQARINQLQRQAVTLKAQPAAAAKTAAALQTTIQFQQSSVASLGTVSAQASTAAPSVPANGWVLHGRVRNASLQPAAQLTVILTDQDKVWQKQYGYAFTDSGGYFSLTYTPPAAATTTTTTPPAAASTTTTTTTGAHPSGPSTKPTGEQPCAPPAEKPCAPPAAKQGKRTGKQVHARAAAMAVEHAPATKAPHHAVPTEGACETTKEAPPHSGSGTGATNPTGATSTGTTQTAAPLSLYLQVLNCAGQVVYADSQSFPIVPGVALYRDIILPGTTPLGTPPPGAAAVAASPS